MNLYNDFYDDQSDNDLDINYKSQLRHKSTNTFVYESLPTKLSKLKIRFNERIDNDYTATKFTENTSEVSYSEKASNFKQILEREKTLNNSAEFNAFYNIVNDYTISYVYVVNNYKPILSALHNAIEAEIALSKIDTETKMSVNWNEKKLKKINSSLIISLLDLMIGIIKDLRGECYDYFVENNLSQIVQLITSNSEDVDLLDHFFSFFVNVFRLLDKSIAINFKRMLVIYSELLFNKNKFIKKFAAQSLCFVIKNLEKDDLIDTFEFLIGFIYHPEQLFESHQQQLNEEEAMRKMEVDLDESKAIVVEQKNDGDKLNKEVSKVIIANSLGGDNQANMKLFVIDALSELIKEILSNGKFISHKSDLIIAKLASNNIIKNDIETIALFVLSFIKLSKRVKSDKCRYNVIALFHFFLMMQTGIVPNYTKLKLDSLPNQLSQINAKDNGYIRKYLLLFSKELLTKNFKIQDSTIGEYIESILSIYNSNKGSSLLLNDNDDSLQYSLILEVSALMIKFYPKMFNISLRNVFIKGKTNKINLFLKLLIHLNNFAFYQSFSLYSNKVFGKYDNDQYDLVGYNKDVVFRIFNNDLLNDIPDASYENIINIITTYDKLFIKDIDQIEALTLENEDTINSLILTIKAIDENDLNKLLSSLTVYSYSEIYVMLRVIKQIQLKKPNEYNSNLKVKVNQIASIALKQLTSSSFSNEEILMHILLNEFYHDNKFYLDKAQGYLTLLVKCKEITNIHYPISNNQYSSYGLYIHLMRSIPIIDYLMLLSSNNSFKRTYIGLYQQGFIIKQDKHIQVITDVFNTMESILNITFDYQNDKKYSINFEVLISKMELLLSDGVNDYKTDLVIFVFYFLIGCHWITLTKSVWVSIAKGVERLFTYYANSPIQLNKEITDQVLFDKLVIKLNELICFIQKYSSESDFISKANYIVKNNYIVFDSGIKEDDAIPLYVQSVSSVLSELNSNEFKTISTFFNGISNSLSTSLSPLLNYNIRYSNAFIDNFISICRVFNNKLELYDPNSKYHESLSLFYNYVLDKETKTSSVHHKLKEALFSILNKSAFLPSYQGIQYLQSIIFEQIILSKSTIIQHLSVEIVASFDQRLVSFKNLLSSVIDSSSYLLQLNNLAETKTDNGQLMKDEERAALIPILTRLYYSKYFSLSAEGGKLKTKNKINLVNYFIQLEHTEFEEYINIIFEPISDVLNKGLWYFDIRTYKKILEILKINLKQITSLFKHKIHLIARIMTNLFLFTKKFGERVKKDNDNVINEINQAIFESNIIGTKYYNYYDKEELALFSKYFLKNVKDLKKESFKIFEMIFHKFYTQTDLLETISNEICFEYKNNLLQHTSRLNSIYKFFLTFSRHAKLHFIYRSNPIVIQAFLTLLSNPLTEKRFMVNIIECIENLLSVYPDKESQLMIIDNDNGKQRDENVIVEEMDINSIDEEENILDIKEDQPVDDVTLNNNYTAIIKANFDQLNSALVSLISNDKIRPTIKDNITLRVIDILLTLWNLTQSNNLPVVNSILSFLFKIFDEDKKIFKEKDILNQILNLCHILIVNKAKESSSIEDQWVLYRKLLGFLFKIENFNSRLLLCIILQEFSNLSPNLSNILELITHLNKNKTSSRSMGVELDDMEVIQKLNIINEVFIMENLDNLEPLIYQLIILSSNDDFAISSLSLEKLLTISRMISLNNAFNKFTGVIEVMFSILKSKFTYAKIILEAFSEMNSVNQSHLVCSDLYIISPPSDIIQDEGQQDNIERSSLVHKQNFLTMILNFKYDLRVEALKLLQAAISSGKITHESIIKVIIPLMRNVLNYKSYSENLKANLRNMRRSNAILTEMTTEMIEVIKIITPLLNEEELKELLLFLFGNLQKISKSKEKDMTYSIDIMKMTNKSLTVFIECLIIAKFSKVEFKLNFNEIAKAKINVKEEKNKNIRIIFSTIFTELNEKNLTLEYKNDQLYRILCRSIYPTLKGMLYDMKKKQSKKYYYIKNYIIPPFLSILKINYPLKMQNDIHQLSLELINNLANLDASIRGKAREGIQELLLSLGEYFSLMLFDDMKTNLHSGYQRHVLGFTVNFILQQVSFSEIYEISIDTLVPILLDELFGEVAEEKEVDALVSKYKEAKNIKGFNSFELISKQITLKTLMQNVLMPFKDFLIQRENNPSIMQRCNEVIINIVRGLKSNSNIVLDDIIEYSYALIHICIEKNLQNAKEVKKLKNIEMKGNDIYSLLISNDYTIEIANNFIKEKNSIIYSNLFASLGLDLLQIAIKKKIIYKPKSTAKDNIKEKNNEIVDGLNEKLSDVLTNVVICLKMSNNTTLIAKSIKILISLFDCKLPIMKKNLMKITKSLFKNLSIINPGDFLLSQAVLSGISDIFVNFSFITVAADKIKQLLDFLKLNINQAELKPYVFSCILSTVKKKVLHPGVYDLIEFIREIYLTSFEENTMTVTQGILVEFLNSYPLEDKAKMAHINFWIVNMESNTRKCRLNAMRMILFLIKKMYKELMIEEVIDFLILKLFTIYSNSDDYDIRARIEEILNQLFINAPNSKFEQYYLNSIKLSSTIDEQNKPMKTFALCVLSLILNYKFDFIKVKELDTALCHILHKDLQQGEKQLEDKITNNDFRNTTNNDDDAININSAQWNNIYQLLILIEKIQANYNHISFQALKLIMQSLYHPHPFIKSIVLKLINNSIDVILGQTNSDTIEGLMKQLKFIVMNNVFEDKVYSNVIGIIVSVASSGLYAEALKEFIEGISLDSKKWISNKDKDKGLGILQRVTTIYNQILLNMKDSNTSLIKFVKPIIDFCFRVTNNTLADSEIKATCEIIMNDITQKMKKEDMTKVYKEVTNEINFLKKKRKMEQIEQFRNKSQQNKEKQQES